jgi:hypothetical protein
LRIGALGGIGMKQIARGVDRSEAQAELAELALEAVALAPAADGCKIEMGPWPWPPGTDAKLDIADAALGAPGEELPPVELRQGVGIDANSHVIALWILQPATVGAGGPSHSTCRPRPTSPALTNRTRSLCITFLDRKV